MAQFPIDNFNPARLIPLSKKIRCTHTKQTVSCFILTFFVSVSSAQTDFFMKLSESAILLTHQKVVYDPKYYSIEYPNGDVPSDRGVCTDVVIRAYRKLGVDLQQEVHEDMKGNFDVYPKNWGLRTTDKNIDHRRVPNLMKFFERKKAKLSITGRPDDYKPGDVVCWNLTGGITHIGIVVNRKSEDGKRNMIVHNIGGGQVLADCLFEYKIIGHYRYGKPADSN